MGWFGQGDCGLGKLVNNLNMTRQLRVKDCQQSVGTLSYSDLAFCTLPRILQPSFSVRETQPWRGWEFIGSSAIGQKAAGILFWFENHKSKTLKERDNSFKKIPF